MIYRIVLILSLYRLSLCQEGRIEKIQKCETRCSKGLQCKSKLHHYFAQCRSQPTSLRAIVTFQNVSLSTVMKCEGRQNCSLHLQAHTALQLSEHIHGFSICILTAGMIFNQCRLVTFPKSTMQTWEGLQVEVQDDFSRVWPSQDVHVTLKTYPSYCGVTWSSTYHVPECSSNDLRSNIPECITGRLAYTVDSKRKKLEVSVSDMLENKDYQLRLCQKGQFTCRDTGENTMIKKDDVSKNATLHYSTPLPCLCIEGWSAMSDAPRVQVCPFKDRLEELWSGITYDPMEATLSWEPVCPVAAVISLCQKRGDNGCEDLEGSLQILNREKITFSGVDPHAQLCMKFTTDSGSWIQCPFADGNFQAWDLSVEQREGQQQLVVTSRVKSPLSLYVCVTTGTSNCSPVHSFHVHVEKSVSLNLTVNLCQPNTCLQVKRLHVKYGTTILHCHPECLVQDDARGHATSMAESHMALQGYWELTLVVISAAALISVVTMAASLRHILTVYWRIRKGQDGVCLSKQHTEPPHTAGHVSLGLQYHEIPVPDTPQFKNSEKANLLK
ncbi:putative interleukin-17 receptor E-like isoform X2 [Esox lucius]|uniref:putative interleukin-17 receptor E-like isoform X2 n=1 Tax=Esox lucius TaxID=8010 RepID=UPI00147768B0|nr:putative interleukin-17 receptor E-like isoform X2 [Esox lucius]